MHHLSGAFDYLKCHDFTLLTCADLIRVIKTVDMEVTLLATRGAHVALLTFKLASGTPCPTKSFTFDPHSLVT